MRAWYDIKQPFFFGSQLLEIEQQQRGQITGGLDFTKPQIVNGYFGYNLIKGDKKAFITKANEISKKLGINVNWLLVVMYKESTLQSKAINETTNAVGLIQFMPKTLAGWGLTWQKVYYMNSVQQLDLVYKFFLPYKQYLKNYPDLYLSAFLPLALNKPNNWPFQVPGVATPAKVQAQNKGIDIDKNGYIDKIDFYKYVYTNLSKDALKLVGSKNNPDADAPAYEIIAKPTYYRFALLAGVIGFVFYTQVKK